MEEYPCKLSELGTCQHGGNKPYYYGFVSGTASYCRLVEQWVADLKKCPKQAKEAP